ncbi:MAG: hypothetical protein B7Y99_02530 [Caulobacterales bacterium 32-69-10]|nr:MAG: hypothetical protein B7Y99_02530 [Caulobacterales bacterium 32-69-10]
MQTHEGARAPARGQRPITPKTLGAAQMASRWRGLPDGRTKADVLRAIDDLDCSAYRLPERARDLLRLIVKHHKKENFRTQSQVGVPGPTDGLELVATLKNDYLAYLLDCSSRHVSRLTQHLVEAGLVLMRDSGNRQRWIRGDIAAPQEVYGFDLRPLIARFTELTEARQRALADFHEARARRRRLSAYMGQVKGLLINPLDPDMIALAERCLKVIAATRQSKDLDTLAMSLRLCEETVENLAAAVIEAAACVTEMSGEPDMEPEQVTPTNESSDTRAYKEAWRGDVQVPSPALDRAETAADWIDAEIADLEPWGAGDEAPGGQSALPCPTDDDQLLLPTIVDGQEVIEIDLRGLSAEEGDLVDLPSSASVLASLPALLKPKGLTFFRDPGRYPTRLSLLFAYGSASASRALLLPDAEIRSQARAVGEKAFAVAALLAEFVPGVRNRRAYFYGIINKIRDGVEPVSLRRSWMRLARVSQPGVVMH